MGRLADRPGDSIPAASRGLAETMAAYRFLDNEKVTFDKVLQPHQDATLQRMQGWTSRPQGHVGRAAANTGICYCTGCPACAHRKLCRTMSAERGNDQFQAQKKPMITHGFFVFSASGFMPEPRCGSGDRMRSGRLWRPRPPQSRSACTARWSRHRQRTHPASKFHRGHRR